MTEQDGEIAPERERLTTRAGRWATRRAGRGRPARDVAVELGCSRRPVNMSVRRWGEALLEAGTERIGGTHALGLDEHLMRCRGRFGTKARSTGIVDAARGRLLDIVPARTAKAPARWLLGRPRGCRAGVRWAVPGLSGPYRAAFDTALPGAGQVADALRVVRLGNDALDDVRRRAQTRRWGAAAANTTTSTGRASCSCRPLRTSPTTDASGCGASPTPATPTATPATHGAAEETLPSLHDIADHTTAAATVAQLASDLQDPGMPEETNRLGRTLWRRRCQISNWHTARVTNAATEAANNLAKRVKRAALGY